MPAELRARLENLLGGEVVSLQPMHGGMVADVRLALLADGRRLVVKCSVGTPLAVEGRMLSYLGQETDLPVPAVHHAADDLLLLEYLEGESSCDVSAERHAAELLAGLHMLTPESPARRNEPVQSGSAGDARRFGFHFDTLVGPFPQENEWLAEWPAFFREKRLRPMLALCLERIRLPPAIAVRLESLLVDLDDILDHAPLPGLIHGDVWAGNLLAKNGRMTGFLDPALYFADPEVELAFIELFGTFGTAFWERYTSLRPVAADYRRRRRDVYQLYPLLVHVSLFGSGYVAGVEERLDRLGY